MRDGDPETRPEGPDHAAAAASRPAVVKSGHRRVAALSLGAALVLASLGFSALAVRSCAAEAGKMMRSEAETRVYQYGSSLSRESQLVLASRVSAFVIPRDFEKKLILGLRSTASVQISCQATILFALDAEALRGLRFSWNGRHAILRAPKPKPLRPSIETSSIRQAILDRGFAFNERAELGKMLAELSDLVAGSAEASLDQATLDACRGSLEEIALKALAGMKRRPAGLTVEWEE